jgi:prepilin-type N-terminal cleavage/methylation domain-containing protein
MKLRSVSSSSRGFTLIELMTTVGIIAVLAGIMISAVGFARSRAGRSKAEAHVKAMRAGLELYRRDFGAFPEPITPGGRSVDVMGVTWEGMGAAVLYQALSGDGDDQVRGGSTASQGRPKSVQDSTMYWDGADFTSNIHRAVQRIDGAYYMVDPWGVPWQYAIIPMEERSNPDVQRNFRNPAIFDMWSYGGAKENELQDERKWITNW